jgi:hypothetical protein
VILLNWALRLYAIVGGARWHDSRVRLSSFVYSEIIHTNY